MGVSLKNKPLVEAIFELRWQLAPTGAPGLASDPNYRVLLGRFSERVQSEYPTYERLGLAGIPDEMVGYQAQHRFRVAPDAWPLVQLGPGLLTVNDTAHYDWDDYQPRCERAIESFLESYPDKNSLQPEHLTLRYINAIPFDFRTSNVHDYLREHLKAQLELPESLFTNKPVHSAPSATNWVVSYPLDEPEGTITVRFASGYDNQEPMVVLETLVTSDAAQVPDLSSGFAKWLAAAHDMTDDWFFKLIEGDLLKRFSDDES